MTLIAKPFITINGIDTLCDKIEKYCITSLAMEPVEWKRSRGSEFKQVHVDVDSRRFSTSNLLDYGHTILDSPLFHLFIFRENEDLYSSKNKDLFSVWIGSMRSRAMTNWNVLILPESSKSKFTLNKFSILQRLKVDFNLTYSEEHFKRFEDSKDEIEQIQYYLRMTVLYYYDTKCTHNEDYIRKIREDIYTQQWDYFEYFLLQEELSDIYECLSLYDEALAQFEEAGFIFTKCVYQYTKADSQDWLKHFRKSGFTKIDCLNFTNFSDPKKHEEIIARSICLPDFRAYMLSRQCALLQMLNRFKEIPDRVYQALLDFINEARMLNIEIDNKLKNCWLYLTGMQALQKFSAIDSEKSVAQSYACLLRLSLSSINKLADSLEIWTANNAGGDWSTVEKLKKKIVVLNNEDFGDTPSSKLNNAFRDLESFRKFHIELYEETITIWKHVGRLRSAAFLGAQLADLYYNSSKYELAEPLYNMAIKMLRNENWAHLAMPLRLKLAVCQKEQFDTNPNKYLKTCVHLAGSTFSTDGFDPDIDLKGDVEHEKYLDELIECINRLYNTSGDPGSSDKNRYRLKLEPLFSVVTVRLLEPSTNTDTDQGKQMLELELVSHLPRDVDADLLLHGIQHYQVDMRTSTNTAGSNNPGKGEYNNSLEVSCTSLGDSLFNCNPGDSGNGGVYLDFSSSLGSQKLETSISNDDSFHDCNIDSPDNGSYRTAFDATVNMSSNKAKQANPVTTYQTKPGTLKRLAYRMKKGSGSLQVTSSFDETKEEKLGNEKEVVVKHHTVCPPNKHQNHYQRNYTTKQLHPIGTELSPVHETANRNEENISDAINGKTRSRSFSKCQMIDPRILVECAPKYDEGQTARRVSISNTYGNVIHSSASSHSIANYMEGEDTILATKFTAGGKQNHRKIRVTRGVNRIKLISEEYGFFSPTMLEMFLFDNKAVASDYIDSNTKLSPEWTDKNFLDKLLPKFVFEDTNKRPIIDPYTSFIDFDSLINPIVKMGTLSIPKLPNLFVETSSDYDIIKNSDLSGSNVTYSKSDIASSDEVLKANCSYELKSPLKYRLNSTTNEISLSLSNIVTRSICDIPVSPVATSPRKLHLSHYVTTANSKYLISIELQPSSTESSSSSSSSESVIEFTLKNPSLKLHHNQDVTQLLKLMHNSLGLGKFNDRSKFVLLWSIDISDIPKIPGPRLVFTLNLDLEMTVDGENQSNSIGESLVLDGSITHQFQLNI